MFTILMFIYGMAVEHSHLITERGDRSPKIFIYVKTHKIVKNVQLEIYDSVNKKAPEMFVLFAKQFSHLKSANK